MVEYLPSIHEVLGSIPGPGWGEGRSSRERKCRFEESRGRKCGLSIELWMNCTGRKNFREEIKAESLILLCFFLGCTICYFTMGAKIRGSLILSLV